MPPLPNYPEFFTRRERALLGARFEELLTPALPIREAPARGVTVNTLRCAPEAFAAGMDIPLAPSPFCRQAFAAPADFRPGRHPWHHAGVFYAQEPSAAGAAPLLDVRPGMRVCDLCAAPGGKSLTLAYAMGNAGALVSCDAVQSRLPLIESAFRRCGVTCGRVLANDASCQNPALGQFDRILCDVPCSGLGVIGKKPDVRYKTLEGLPELAALQQRILRSAAASLAPGGRLVYSTCTLNPQENEDQIRAFCRDHPQFAVLPPASAPEGAADTGFGTLLLPDRTGTDGFFAAILVRKPVK